jgi:hypothetical protein
MAVRSLRLKKPAHELWEAAPSNGHRAAASLTGDARSDNELKLLNDRSIHGLASAVARLAVGLGRCLHASRKRRRCSICSPREDELWREKLLRPQCIHFAQCMASPPANA